VEGPAKCVIEPGVWGEGAVTAFVGEDPEADKYAALEEAVGCPG
jgi:hypothetical protein